MKKKILFQSDYSLAKTGFGRNAKAVLSYLYKTGKYDIVHYCCGYTYSNPELKNTPWKSVGTLPDNQREIEHLQSDPTAFRSLSYGVKYLDKVIQEEKPDIYIAVQDIWGIDYAVGKDWFSRTNSVLWSTLDSLPLLPSAVAIAPKVKNYWIWSSFATDAMHELGHKHVRTMHGAIEDENFYSFSEQEKLSLRGKHGLPEDAFIIGFVFRNQLRKSVPNLIEGYKIFTQENPSIRNPMLLLHTNFDEENGGWDINKLAEEYGVPRNEILTTYVCGKCKNYEVKPYQGKGLPCEFCAAKDSQNTCGVQLGVHERQLNEVYNLMDVYCHPFTSGGQEFPIQEAKLTELITLVTNYSCGEEMCQEGAYSMPLDWAEYREHNTQFRKASTLPSSIAEQLKHVYELPAEERAEAGKGARKWALENYSVESVGKQIEDFIDSCPEVDKSIYEEGMNKNPDAVIDGGLSENDWVQSLYSEILDRKNVTMDDKGFLYWKQELKKGVGRADVEKYFRRIAKEDFLKEDFGNFLNKEDAGKRILYVMPEGIADVFYSTSLFKSAKHLYPECNLYVATRPEFFEILDGNPYVYKVIPYLPDMDNLLWLEGNGDHEGYFEVAFLPYVNTQRMFTYQHNGKDKLEYDLSYVPV